ncbi:WD repeat domain phosphoinositide-interacting protein [Aureobasidium pullulans]|uniref:WD repeat domain phosphoinositide-interacting protein n=1 Tax=Aureobasidium pullulans TaxID=5580 RepID=A0A4S9SIQ7_AURPU|nr:WD repeat domain phosphoinositide-interacting protein [Aureobasidium pullulans]
MHTYPPSGTPPAMALNYITFNQDHSFLAVATSDGMRVYSTNPFALLFQTPLTENGASGDIAILEMLFSTSLVAMILSPRHLRIVNTKRQTTVCELTFPARVGALKLNRKRLLVVMEDLIFVYDVSSMKLLSELVTPSNPYAICALSPDSTNNYIAYPMRKKEYMAQPAPTHVPPAGPRQPEPMGGDVMLFDANDMQEVKVIPAHQAPLSCIAMNKEGTLLATASEKGTVIRVFAIPSAQKLYQFRRGSMPARIHSMSFNERSTLLCVSSATETIHIFRLSGDNTMPQGLESPSENAPSTPRRYQRDRSDSPTGSSDPSSSTSLGDSPADPSAKPLRSPGWMSMVRRTSQNVSTSFMSRAAGYLPKGVTEIWEPTRDFAWVRIPKGRNGSPVKSVVAMAEAAPEVMVATSEGDFLIYNIDLENGGEGTLVRQHSVRERSETHSGFNTE